MKARLTRHDRPTHPTGSESGSPSPPDAQRLLEIYLNDHLAGASGGVSLIRRMARAHRGTPAGPPLAELAEQIAEDRESLREIMTALDVPAQWPRVVVARLAEKAGRAKLNGRLVSRSPLSDVLELEAMRIGVEGKALLWQSLGLLADPRHHLEPAAVDRLLTRARQQAAVLEELREEAARRSFTPTAAGPAPSGRSQARPDGAPRPGGVSRRAGWA
ncbi:hypothetical protein ACGFZK_37020 [Streptomyces sp. NPDC048257]|uniref:hypothetical protein n=1 Tax=Streptomyces sp. NPDC048257 TaxID=3365526 RepID=UPI00371615F3